MHARHLCACAGHDHGAEDCYLHAHRRLTRCATSPVCASPRSAKHFKVKPLACWVTSDDLEAKLQVRSTPDLRILCLQALAFWARTPGPRAGHRAPSAAGAQAPQGGRTPHWLTALQLRMEYVKRVASRKHVSYSTSISRSLLDFLFSQVSVSTQVGAVGEPVSHAR